MSRPILLANAVRSVGKAATSVDSDIHNSRDGVGRDAESTLSIWRQMPATPDFTIVCLFCPRPIWFRHFAYAVSSPQRILATNSEQDSQM